MPNGNLRFGKELSKMNLVTIVFVFVFWRHNYTVLNVFFWLWMIIVLGIWAATVYDAVHQTEDSGAIVIDEVAGQIIALLPLLVMHETGPWLYVLSIALFRFFDIRKPLGIAQLQALPQGLGVMIDDVVAGVYAAILLVGVIWIRILL